jgi:hypothetical protein
MKVERADEWARRVFEIYCAVWQTQGNVKSGTFVRGVGAHIIRMLEVRARSIAREFSRFVRATNLPFSLREAHLKKLDFRMRQLQGRWQRRLEIEARECEHAERKARLAQQAIQSVGAAAKVSTEVLAETNGGPPAAETRQARLPRNGPKKKKPGRPPRLGRPFVECAGALWQRAIVDSHCNVSIDKLRQIAFALDTANYLPPSAYLEPKYARPLKEFNSRNSNSKRGPVETWSQLIAMDDKDYLRGMRCLLSRCAKKLDGLSMSGN